MDVSELKKEIHQPSVARELDKEIDKEIDQREVTGSSPRGNGRIKRSAQNMWNTFSDSPGFWLLLVLALVILYFDSTGGFDRQGGALLGWISVYSFFGLIAYFTMPKQSGWDPEVFKTVLWRTLIAVFLPYIFGAGSAALEGAALSIGSGATALVQTLLIVISPLFAAYLAWPSTLLSLAAKKSIVFGIINIFIIAIIASSLLMGVLDSFSQNPIVAGGLNGQGEPVNWWDVIKSGWNTIIGAGERLYDGVRNEAGERIANATQRQYVGEVERQQGQVLGVLIRNQEPLKPIFEFIQDENGSLRVGDSTAVWFGNVEAKTFADDFQVDLGCEYEASNGSTLVAGSANPEEVTVFYTGGDAADVYPFQCEVSLQEVYDATNQGTRLNGQFITTADFDFETWGYATLTFADRRFITEVRRDGGNVARELGIDQRIRAFYTPGPVSLGMFEQQTLPIGVTLENASRTFLPAFGITLRNDWTNRGNVREINRVVLQVPDPLDLDTDQCSGVTGDQIQPLSAGSRLSEPGSGSSQVPQGYTWFVITDFEPFDDDQQLRNIRCPLSVPDSEISDLLEADFSAKQLSLVARAQYSYRSEDYAPVRVGVVRN